MLKTNEMMGACVARRRAWGRGALAVALAGSLALAGCTGGTFEEAAEGAGEKSEQGQSGRAQGDSGATGTTDGVDWASLIDIPGMDFEYSDRDKDASYDVASATNIALSGQGATVSGEGAAVEGTTVTITAAGTYAVTGELTAGSLVVNADGQDKVQIVLSGASIRNEAGPALNIQQADKVFVTLADGTQNTLADGASYELAEGEDEPNAALYSKADLTINGTGALSVEGNYRHGVNCKDDLVVTGGAITVVAKEDGLRGKDCVKVADGSFAITAGGDGVKSSNDEDPTRGFVSIDGGAFAVEAGDEGFPAATYLRLAGGDAQIKAADHALRSDVEAAMIGGTYVVEAGGKGMNPETKFTMDGGTFTVTGCEEGIEAQEVIVNNGELNITASDDGINAAVAERDSNDATIDASGDADRLSARTIMLATKAVRARATAVRALTRRMDGAASVRSFRTARNRARHPSLRLARTATARCPSRLLDRTATMRFPSRLLDSAPRTASDPSVPKIWRRVRCPSVPKARKASVRSFRRVSSPVRCPTASKAVASALATVAAARAAPWVLTPVRTASSRSTEAW